MNRLACVSVSGGRVPLSLLEKLAVSRDELPTVLRDLQRRLGTAQVCVLSTCERTEVYAISPSDGDPPELINVLADNRRVPAAAVGEVASRFTGRAAARHLLRVTSGLESFVVGENDIVGQVRAAAEASRKAATADPDLERLVAAAVNTSRRVHRRVSFGQEARSLATFAVRVAAARYGGWLARRRVLVVGGGQVATDVVAGARKAGAIVTVCNRTRRHVDRFAEAGVAVLDLDHLFDQLAVADVAIFGTAAPQPLADATRLAAARPHPSRELTIVDLCVPRNVEPQVRELPGVRLLDLTDLKGTGREDGGELTRAVALAESIIEEELDRYQRRLAERARAASVQRLRADIELCVQDAAARIAREVPKEYRTAVEAGLQSLVNRLAHGPTERLLEAAGAEDDELVESLAGMFGTASLVRGSRA